MGLLQKAVETYDTFEHLAGVAVKDKQTLAPIAHTIRDAEIEITVDGEGNFISAAKVDKADSKTVIPVTQDSLIRAGKKAADSPHPLSDKLAYYLDENKRLEKALEAWNSSQYTHPKLKPVLKYIQSGTISADLLKAEIIKDPSNTKESSQLVRWIVVGIGEHSGNTWTDKSLMQAYINYTLSTLEDSPKNICMISGDNTSISSKHSGVVFGNTKLISDNDGINFTYRGRFTDSVQALTVGYISSQKAHNAIRWLSSEQSVCYAVGTESKRAFLCWNPQGKSAPHAARSLIRKERAKASAEPTEYKAELKRTLDGYKAQLPSNCGGVVIAVFDAATTGRLSLTYYNELESSDFLERLKDWDEHCCWWAWDFESHTYSIQSPPLYQIINCAFGTQREEKGKSAKLVTDDRLMKQYMQSLMSCRIDKGRFPTDIERAIVNRASAPLAFDPGIRTMLLSTACAVIKKYHYDYFKEEIEMALDKERRDRSYQYGRMLAVFEKVEQHVNFENGEKRETNAIRLMSMFCKRPLHTSTIIFQKLRTAYFRQLPASSQEYYNKLLSEIHCTLSECENGETDKPLGDTYLIGYYLQRNELYKSKEDRNKEEK